MIEFRVLGGVDLRDSEGRELRSVLVQPKRLALLAYLAAASRDEFHRRDTLLGLFWPQLDEGHGRSALNRAVYCLRKTLGAEVLVSRGGEELGIDRARLRCDAAVFADALRRGRPDEALEQYRGDLLQGLFLSAATEFEHWLEVERARLRRLAAGAAWQVVEGTDDPAAALSPARRAVELSGEDEDGFRRYLALLDRAGDRAGALRAYEEFARRLRRDFDVEPAPETRAVAARVRSRGGDPVREPQLPTRSLAVLPFMNLSGDTDGDYFSDGVTEEIIGRLAAMHELRVISRTSVMQYKNTRKGVREIAVELRVASIIEGSVRRAGGRVRIAARLIEAAGDAPLWSDSYDGDLADIFRVQSEVAASIAHALRVKLTAEEASQIGKVATRDLAAYELYLRGRYLLNRFVPETLPQAIVCFEQALVKDPAYALAHAGLAEACIAVPWFRPAKPDGMTARARDAAEQALLLDPTLAEAHAVLGEISATFLWDWAAAERHFRQALELNPNSVPAREYRAACLAKTGRADEAVAEMDAARQLDPFSPGVNALSGLMRIYARRYDEALARLRSTLELDPTYPLAHLFLGWAYRQKGMHEEAVASARRAVEFGGGSPAQVAHLAAAHAFAGDTERARALLANLERRAQNEWVQPAHRSVISLGLGDRDGAIRWLEQGCEDRDFMMASLRADPVFDPLRDDARFGALLDRVGLG